jgi:hypothetical protein
MDREIAQSLIGKLRQFTAETLDDRERELFATLLAPGIARAYADADEVRGYGLEEPWSALPLADALLAQLEALDDSE